MKHRFVALVLALALLLVPFDVNAAENDSTIDMHNTGDVLLADDCSECLEENSEIAPQYEPVCGSYAYHHMNSSGFGTVMKNNSAYLTNASAWQCSRCLLVMVTEGDLVYGTMTTIGKYAIVGAGAIVTKDVGDYEVAVGVPAKIVKTLDKDKFKD